MDHKCHNLSLLNSRDDTFIIKPCLMVKDRVNNKTGVKFILWRRLLCPDSRLCDSSKKICVIAVLDNQNGLI